MWELAAVQAEQGLDQFDLPCHLVSLSAQIAA